MPSERVEKSARVVPNVVEAAIVAQYRRGELARHYLRDDKHHKQRQKNGTTNQIS